MTAPAQDDMPDDAWAVYQALAKYDGQHVNRRTFAAIGAEVGLSGREVDRLQRWLKANGWIEFRLAIL